MTTLVTGGTGFAGAATVRELARRGERIAVLSRDASSVAERFPGLDVEARAGDVSDPSKLAPAFADIETVINCVQFPNSPIENKARGWTFEQIDYLGTVHQVEAARDAGVKRFVYISGVGASLEATKHWFAYKARAEGVVRASDMTHVIIRPTWIFGPEDVSLNRFLGFARWLPFVPMFGDGQQAMQPLFIDDLGRLLADAAAKTEANNATFEAGGPDRISMDGVIQAALAVSGKRRPILHQPVALGKGLARMLQLLPSPPLTPDAIDFITHPAVADNTELERVFSPRLTPLREGLATYLGNAKQEGRV